MIGSVVLVYRPPQSIEVVKSSDLAGVEDKDANVVHVGNATEQTRHVLETIKGVVEAAGGSMDDVTFNMIMLKDWADYAAINAVYAEYFAGEKPARYCIQCGLVKPEALIEIASIAHVGK